MKNNFSIDITTRYLNFPVKTGADKVNVYMHRNNKLVRYFNLELTSPTDYDFYVFYDVSELIGQTISFDCEDTNLQEVIVQTEEPLEADTFYKEEDRPQFHFSAKRGWLNDPNGMFYYQGKYHLFYQHNPFGWSWGNMHWGHAVSTDMIHWEEQPEALYPDETGSMFSGGAVVDNNNTSGLKQGDNAPILLFYTAAGNQAPVECEYTQGMAYSTDGGNSWEKYNKNPVLGHVMDRNRDPHISCHQDSQQWVMSLFLGPERGENPDAYIYGIYGSKNLTDWNEICRIDMPNDECPNFWEMKVENEDVSKWVLRTAAGAYLVGDFDGKQFTPAQEAIFDNTSIRDNQACSYAGQIFNNIPESDGRCIQFNWLLGAESPGMPFNQIMSTPLELTLRNTADGYRMCFTPVRELEKLHTNTCSYNSAEELNQAKLNGEFYDFTAEFSDAVSVCEFDIKGIKVALNLRENTIICLGRTLPLSGEKCSQIRFLIDRGSLEMFTDNGRIYFPTAKFKYPKDGVISMTTDTPEAFTFTVHEMKSIWRHEA